ncbi:nuclear transport factor 2 family protein [Dyella amyloliquefaciens]|uniref:nuclear transport factor 2 family protein n=1 Tax=Dyella amyloliquefaciens TaxID=1770545 RepID=UPI00102E99C4|nr:nuclear transport factor 2 family protein [Dyella amyloliquefaciens]
MKDLPKPIGDYFAADRFKDAEVVSQCFTEDSIVVDEGHTYKGRAAIKRWKEESSTKYQYTSTPFAIAEDGDKIVVTSHLVGTFPGSPVDLRYIFALQGDKVAGLEITV